MRVLMCDDHLVGAEPVAALLARRGHEVKIATSPAEALELADEYDPEVCLMEVDFPGGVGLDAIRTLRRRQPDCAIVALSASISPRHPSAAVAAGAVGFVRKDQSITAIYDALDKIAAGAEVGVFQPSVRPAAPADERGRVRRCLAELTEREGQVFRHLMKAHDTDTIARALGVAPSTVRTHLQNVLLKLGVHSRMQAVSLVAGAGLDGEL